MCPWRCRYLPPCSGKITVGGKEIIVHAAVAKPLPVASLLGWDVPELMGSNPDAESSDTVKALAVVTCQAPETSSCDTDSPNPPSEAPPDLLRPDEYIKDPLVTTDPSGDLMEEEPNRQHIAKFDLNDSLFSSRSRETSAQPFAETGRSTQVHHSS